jgi:hypothetical protein
MKKIIFILTTVNISLFCYSQTTTIIRKPCLEGNCFNGQGKYQYDDGIYSGSMYMDKAHGSGEYKYNNGDVYVGDFKEGLYLGEGKKTYANGKIENGAWAMGVFMGNNNMSLKEQGNLATVAGLAFSLNEIGTKKFFDAFEMEKFVMEWNGEKLWKMGFKGGTKAHIDPKLIEKAKIGTIKLAEQYPIFKVAGVTASGITIAISVSQFASGEIGGGEFSMDIVFVGISLIPLGWVPSSIYFISKNFVDYDKMMTEFGKREFENIKNGRIGIMKF